jgi:2-keto-4-pentenoate hydratase/2-oxohepta-3-ene-1,7-dioic acid hydratase in catechol pathway
MRIANLAGRLVIVTADGSAAADVEKASRGRFGPHPQPAYEDWPAFRAWAEAADLSAADSFDVTELGAPAPAPRQLFAIGLNYLDHAAEAGLTAPEEPTVFTKWASCLSGPVTEVALPADGQNDWEVELVVVLGRGGRGISEAEAWDHVAGLTVGQDLSARAIQLSGPAPQWSLGKSLPGFGPMGPWLVTTDELDDPADLAISCAVDGQQVQAGRTADMIFSVPVLIAKLSALLPLFAGDVIFTGTPPGVGVARKPPRFLRPGQELVSQIAGIGELRQRFV